MRMTGATGEVSACTYAELSRRRLLDTDQRIPRLEEVLELVAGRVPLLVEVKSTGRVGECEQRLVKLLADYHGEVAVQSFNPLSLRYLRSHAPQIPRGQISGLFRDVDLGEAEVSWLVRKLLRNLLLNGLSRPAFIVYQLEGLPAAAVSIARRLGLPALVWTVTSPATAVTALKYADNFIFEGFTPSSMTAT